MRCDKTILTITDAYHNHPPFFARNCSDHLQTGGFCHRAKQQSAPRAVRPCPFGSGLNLFREREGKMEPPEASSNGSYYCLLIRASSKIMKRARTYDREHSSQNVVTEPNKKKNGIPRAKMSSQKRIPPQQRRVGMVDSKSRHLKKKKNMIRE